MSHVERLRRNAIIPGASWIPSTPSTPRAAGPVIHLRPAVTENERVRWERANPMNWMRTGRRPAVLATPRRLPLVLHPEPLGEDKRYTCFKGSREDTNNHPVIVKPKIADKGRSFMFPSFFRALGDRRHEVPGHYAGLGPDGKPVRQETSSRDVARDLRVPARREAAIATLKRRAEQEYIRQAMVPEQIHETSEIARKYDAGVAMRPTNMACHLLIQAGHPVKPQEVKNKTTTDEDWVLRKDIQRSGIGKVGHFDPRVRYVAAPGDRSSPWQRKLASIMADPEMKGRLQKLVDIEAHRNKSLTPEQARANVLARVEKQFDARVEEFRRYDKDYRPGGKFAAHIFVAGPFLRPIASPGPDGDFVGDLDPFAFFDAHGKIIMQPPPPAGMDPRFVQPPPVLAALMDSHATQVQHADVASWQVPDKHRKIRDDILDKHAPGGDPPVLFQPDGTVTLGYYVKETNSMESVWSKPADPAWLNWMTSTASGLVLLQALEAEQRGA